MGMDYFYMICLHILISKHKIQTEINLIKVEFLDKGGFLGFVVSEDRILTLTVRSVFFQACIFEQFWDSLPWRRGVLTYEWVKLV